MKKTIFAVCAVITLVYFNAAFAKNNGDPFNFIWDAITDLQKQIDNIELIPGPQGPKGDKGDIGPAGPSGSPAWDEQRILGLEAKVEELQNELTEINSPSDSTITLWENYHPVQDRTEGQVINAENKTNFSLNFSWHSGTLTHTCQYAYTFYDAQMNQMYYSTFWYFPNNSCTGIVNIPIPAGTHYVKVDAWTPPSGILNGNLSLFP